MDKADGRASCISKRRLGIQSSRSNEQISIRVRKYELVRSEIGWAPLIRRELEVEVHDKSHQNYLDLKACEESTRTGILAVSEVKYFLLCSRELMEMTFAWSLTIIIIAKTIEDFRIGCHLWIILDGVDRHANVGILWQCGPITEYMAFLHDSMIRQYTWGTKALTFLHEAVQFAQFGVGCLVPAAVRARDFSHLPPYLFEILRMRSHVIEHVNCIHL